MWLIIAICCWTTSGAADSPAAGALPSTVVVQEAEDGDTLLLDGGRKLRLIGIMAPKTARADRPAEALASTAQAALDLAAAGKTLRLAAGGPMTDRHGRLLALAYGAGADSLQEIMLARGLARVYLLGDATLDSAPLFAAEDAARQGRRGLWASATILSPNPTELSPQRGRFVILQGRVRHSARVDDTIYINFGADWRTDTTISLPSRMGAALRARGLRWQDLPNRLIEARGWLEDYNGPHIRLAHPDLLRVQP